MLSPEKRRAFWFGLLCAGLRITHRWAPSHDQANRLLAVAMTAVGCLGLGLPLHLAAVAGLVVWAWATIPFQWHLVISLAGVCFAFGVVWWALELPALG